MGKFLNELRPGEKAIIDGVEDNTQLKKRLIELGIRAGKEVLMRRDAPLGDPMEINIMGYNITLRKSEARYVKISNIESIGMGRGTGRGWKKGMRFFGKRRGKSE